MKLPLLPLALSALASAHDSSASILSKCPGYKASNVKTSAAGLTADLSLAGPACDAYGHDLDALKLSVVVETASRVHVKIYDAAERVYQVPEAVFPRPKAGAVAAGEAHLKFEYTASPFSFRIVRSSGGGEAIFDSSAASLVFEDQFLRLRTKLPSDPNLYGLGEHSDSFRLNPTNHTLTLWNADNPLIPEHQNIYGSHPLYLDHRASGSHGVFLLNSNGMDVHLDKDPAGQQYLEYNAIGGVLDFYFMAGPAPVDVVQQYAEVAGLTTSIPYAALGFHNLRWGYRDAFDVAEVITNYSNAKIPLETQWVDIDYMQNRSIFSLDPDRFPLHMMRGIVDHLHKNKQKFTLMVDPAVAARDYGPYNRGVAADAFLLNSTGQPFNGVVWPGLTSYPDWFQPSAQEYWNDEFARFFAPGTGVDIDFLWIDMNEASNFCDYPCTNPEEAAKNYPPPPPAVRPIPRSLPGWPCDFQPEGTNCKRAEVQLQVQDSRQKQLGTPPSPAPEVDQWKGLPDRDLQNPKYAIQNIHGPLSHKTINVTIRSHNGLAQYDTHNLYGTMMSAASRAAMISRRPTKRPLVVTRSTYAGAGSHVSHWLGDNASDWPHYRWTIRGMLQFASLFQVAMVGSDVCGFAGDVTEELCARWAMLGAFQPFYRNHNSEGQRDQEFYRWESVAAAARKAIDIRYRLLDYFYTAMMRQSKDGTPAVSPVFFAYPTDEKTFDLELQYFYGPSLLVAPVIEEGASSVDVYLPDDVFYDFYTHERIEGQGTTVTVKDQSLTDIPLFLRGGTIVPLRVSSGMTTHDVRKEHFELVVALGRDGTAEGELYLDDGESLSPERVSWVRFVYRGGQLSTDGAFGYEVGSRIIKVTVLGADKVETKVDMALTAKGSLHL